MFSKPEYGWVWISVGDCRIEGSYLTDIPMDFLNALINSLENDLPFSVSVDEEGIRDMICADRFGVFVIELRKGTAELKQANISLEEFRAEIIDGVEAYFDQWVYDWELLDLDRGDRHYALRKAELESRLSTAKRLLNG